MILYSYILLYILSQIDKLYSLSEFAKKVNVSSSTLRRWDSSGEFKAKRRESGHRYYDESDVRSLLNLTPLEDRKSLSIVVYRLTGRKTTLPPK